MRYDLKLIMSRRSLHNLHTLWFQTVWFGFIVQKSSSVYLTHIFVAWCDTSLKERTNIKYFNNFILFRSNLTLIFSVIVTVWIFRRAKGEITQSKCDPATPSHYIWRNVPNNQKRTVTEDFTLHSCIGSTAYKHTATFVIPADRSNWRVS